MPLSDLPLAVGDPGHSLVCKHITPISASILTCPSLSVSPYVSDLGLLIS